MSLEAREVGVDFGSVRLPAARGDVAEGGNQLENAPAEIGRVLLLAIASFARNVPLYGGDWRQVPALGDASADPACRRVGQHQIGRHAAPWRHFELVIVSDVAGAL